MLYDADWLVNLRDEYDIQNRKNFGNLIEKVFLIESRKALAGDIYLQEG